MNLDDTIVTRNKVTQEFNNEISFFANDYESPELEVRNGQVVFKKCVGGYKREKICPAPKNKYIDVREILDNHEPVKDYPVTLKDDVLSLLEDGLSHIEFHNVDGYLKILQKDIYSGQKIEVEKIQEGMFPETCKMPENLPIGLRTVDFKALFSFQSQLTFYFQDKNYIYFKNGEGDFEGIISTCIYDEIGYIEK